MSWKLSLEIITHILQIVLNLCRSLPVVLIDCSCPECVCQLHPSSEGAVRTAQLGSAAIEIQQD